MPSATRHERRLKMLKCDGCDKWLDLQSDAVALDEGTLCPECATEWYGESLQVVAYAVMPPPVERTNGVQVPAT